VVMADKHIRKASRVEPLARSAPIVTGSESQGRVSRSHGATKPAGSHRDLARARAPGHTRDRASRSVPKPKRTTARAMAKADLSRKNIRPLDPILHIALPGFRIAQEQPRQETISAFLKRTGWASRTKSGWKFSNTPLPTICVINGAPVLRKEWSKRQIGPTDQIQFWSRPQGGGMTGTQIAGLAAVLALTVFAPYLGGLAVGAAFGSAAAGMTIGATGVTLASVAGAAIALGGTLLIATLLKPKSATQEGGAPKDQIFSVSAAGNTVRLLEPINLNYGRVRSFPPYATIPWSEFEGNDQYLNILLSVGLGSYESHQIDSDDTPVWTSGGGISSNFENVQIAFYEPNTNVTLFPLNVVAAAEVSGQQLIGQDYPSVLPGDWVGGFIVGAPGTTTTTLALDFEFPSGIFAQDSTGTHAYSTHVEVEARPVDSSGVPTGSYVQIISNVFTYKTKTPQRATLKVDVAPGRYQVRARKVNSEINPDQPNGASGSDAMHWSTLKAYLSNTPTSFRTSTIAIRMKATNQLSGQGSHRFAVTRTRKLPVFNGTTWSAPQATRNPFAAFWDAATNTEYGGNRDLSKMDLDEIYAYWQGADVRGDKFDYEFTGAMPFPDAFDLILKPARSWHKWNGDQLSTVRDEWRTIPQLMITDRETVRDSAEIDFILNQEDQADAVVVEYLDENTWRPASVQFPPENEIESVNPSRKRIDGIVTRDHAFREAAFLWRQAQLRRKGITLETEYDGRVVGLGSHIAVQSDLPVIWGSSGEVLSVASNQLTVRPTPAWGSGQHYVNLRNRWGRPFGPIMASQGASPNIIVLDYTDLAAVETAQAQTLAAVLTRSSGGDAPSFSLGTSLARGIVLGGRPSGENMQLIIALDNIDVHAGDLGTIDPTPVSTTPIEPRVPTVSGLQAYFTQGIAEPILHASWLPSAGASRYTAQISYDAGVNWEHAYEGRDNNFTLVVQPANIRLRVQAVSRATDLPGPSSYKNVTFGGTAINAEQLLAGSLSITPFADTIEPVVLVSTLPEESGYIGPRVIFNTTDQKLYTYVDGAWDTPLFEIPEITFGDFAAGIEPVSIVTVLPSASGYIGPKNVYHSGEGRLYSYVGSQWTTTTHEANLLVNGDFENGGADGSSIVAGWTHSGSSTSSIAYNTVATQSAYSGARHIFLVKADATSATWARAISGRFEVASGATYEVSCAVKAASGSSATGFFLEIDWYDEDEVYISTVAAVNNGTIPASWTLRSGSVTAPSNARYAYCLVYNFQGTVASMAIDSVAVRKSIGETQILPNSITTPKIVALAITSALLATDSVIAGKIAAAAVNAREIAAGAIVAGKIAVGAGLENLLRNGNFQDNAGDGISIDSQSTYGWSLFGDGTGRFLRSSTGSDQSDWHADLSAGTGATQCAMFAAPVPVNAGQTYEVGGWFVPIGSTDTDPNALIVQIVWANESGFEFTTSNFNFPMPAGWNKRVSQVVAPTTAVIAQVRFYINSFATGGAMRRFGVTDAALRKASGITHIEDGSITTNKLVALSVISDKLAANSVIFGKVAAGAIRASEINADAISTTHLQVDGVQITDILAGSAGNIQQATASDSTYSLGATGNQEGGTSMPNLSSYNVPSDASGKVIAEFTCEIIGSAPAINADIYLLLYIDNVVVGQSLLPKGFMTDLTNVGNRSTVWIGSASARWTATVSTNANHAFECTVKVVSNSGGPGGGGPGANIGFNLYKKLLTVQEVRK
jgi:hypothetical protein